MKPLSCITLSILLSINAFSQIQINRSYLNMTRPSGGPIAQNDILEMRIVLSVPNGTSVSSLVYTDVIPSSLTYVAGTLRVATNEDAVVGGIPNTGSYSDAAGDDQGQVIAKTVTVYMGTGATSSAGGSITGGTTTPLFYNSATILMVTYQVKVAVASGSQITTAGSFSYVKGGTPTTTAVAATTSYVYQSLTCSSLGPTNYLTAESNGTFGSGSTHNRGTSSTKVTGYTFVSLTSGNPVDGDYSITNNTSATAYTGASPASSDKVFSVWDIFGDHTGSGSSTSGNAPVANGTSGGYLLAVNGTFAPSSIFSTSVTGLTASSIYTMSFWVRNMCPTCGCDPSTGTAVGTPGVKPDISVSVNGFNYYNSGDLTYSNSWVQKTFTFQNGGSSSVTFDIKNNAPGGGGNDFAIDDIAVNQCLILLPVGLQSFTGRLTSQGVMLNWQTEYAATTAYFDVERSADGTHFYSLDQVAADANTSRYDYTDASASADAAEFFYRLRVLDHDGVYSYSNVLRIKTGATTGTLTTRLAPNPARENSTLYIWSDAPGTAQVSLFNLAGALVYSREAILTGGSNAVDIRLPNHLPTGIYLVKTVMGPQSVVTRLAVE